MAPLKSKECEIEGCSLKVWSKNRCKFHSIQEYHSGERKKQYILKKSPLKKKIKSPEEKMKRKQEKEEMFKFFLTVWDSQADEYGDCRCYETGKLLTGKRFRNNICCYHHLLSKSSFPEYTLDLMNIVILHPNTHAQVEMNIDKCPKVKELTIKIREYYGK